MFECILTVGLDHVPVKYGVLDKIAGEKCKNIEYIERTTGSVLEIIGRGSDEVDELTGKPSEKPLQIILKNTDQKELKVTRTLVESLIKRVQEEFRDFKPEVSEPAKKNADGGPKLSYCSYCELHVNSKLYSIHCSGALHAQSLRRWRSGATASTTSTTDSTTQALPHLSEIQIKVKKELPSSAGKAKGQDSSSREQSDSVPLQSASSSHSSANRKEEQGSSSHKKSSASSMTSQSSLQLNANKPSSSRKTDSSSSKKTDSSSSKKTDSSSKSSRSPSRSSTKKTNLKDSSSHKESESSSKSSHSEKDKRIDTSSHKKSSASSTLSESSSSSQPSKIGSKIPLPPPKNVHKFTATMSYLSVSTMGKLHELYDAQISKSNLKYLYQKVTGGSYITDVDHGKSSHSFCSLCVQDIKGMGHYQDPKHCLKYMNLQLDLGLDNFSKVFGHVPYTVGKTNNGKKLAVSAVRAFNNKMLPDGPSERDLFAESVVLTERLAVSICSICKHDCGQATQFYQHIGSKKHIEACMLLLAEKDDSVRELKGAVWPPPAFVKRSFLWSDKQEKKLMNHISSKSTVKLNTLKEDKDAAPKISRRVKKAGEKTKHADGDRYTKSSSTQESPVGSTRKTAGLTGYQYQELCGYSDSASEDESGVDSKDYDKSILNGPYIIQADTVTNSEKKVITGSTLVVTVNKVTGRNVETVMNSDQAKKATISDTSFRRSRLEDSSSGPISKKMRCESPVSKCKASDEGHGKSLERTSDKSRASTTKGSVRPDDKPSSKAHKKPREKSPDGSHGKSHHTQSDKSPEKLSGRSPEKSHHRSNEKSSDKSHEESHHKSSKKSREESTDRYGKIHKKSDRSNDKSSDKSHKESHHKSSGKSHKQSSSQKSSQSSHRQYAKSSRRTRSRSPSKPHHESMHHKMSRYSYSRSRSISPSRLSDHMLIHRSSRDRSQSRSPYSSLSRHNREHSRSPYHQRRSPSHSPYRNDGYLRDEPEFRHTSPSYYQSSHERSRSRSPYSSSSRHCRHHSRSPHHQSSPRDRSRSPHHRSRWPGQQSRSAYHQRRSCSPLEDERLIRNDQPAYPHPSMMPNWQMWQSFQSQYGYPAHHWGNHMYPGPGYPAGSGAYPGPYPWGHLPHPGYGTGAPQWTGPGMNGTASGSSSSDKTNAVCQHNLISVNIVEPSNQNQPTNPPSAQTTYTPPVQPTYEKFPCSVEGCITKAVCFGSQSDLDSHISETHKLPRWLEFHCPIHVCSYKAKTRQDIDRHMYSDHGDKFCAKHRRVDTYFQECPYICDLIENPDYTPSGVVETAKPLSLPNGSLRSSSLNVGNVHMHFNQWLRRNSCDCNIVKKPSSAEGSSDAACEVSSTSEHA